MNDISKEPCKRCGLIQPKDIIFGLMICDAEEASFFGCPPRKFINTNYPDWIYEENIYQNRTVTPIFPGISNE